GVRRAEKSALGASTRYDGRIASDFAGLIGRQRPDGGWAWCDDPLCSTDPYVTAWALFAIGEAKKDGMTVDPNALGRGAGYVMAYLSGPNLVALPSKGEPQKSFAVPTAGTVSPNDKAFLLAGVASAGGLPSISPVRALFEQDRARLVNWGRAYLLLALSDAGAPNDDPSVRALVNDLSAAAIPTANGDHWEDDVRGRFMTNTAT